MNLDIALCKVEWMMGLFDTDGNLKLDIALPVEAAQPATVDGTIDAGVIGIVEGSDITVSGTRSAAGQLEYRASHFGLYDTCSVVEGIASSGRRDMCAPYRRSMVDITHNLKLQESRHPFNQPFIADTNEALVMEPYEHYRPSRVDGHKLCH